MITVTDLYSLPLFPKKPCALTLGCFDGVHLGHQYLLSQVIKKAHDKGSSIVMSFPNHPMDVLRPHQARIPLLSSPKHKLALLEKLGIDYVYFVPFTDTLKELTYEQFLVRLFDQLRFSSLILGKGAAFGKQKKGNEANITKLSHELGFTVDYIHKKELSDEMISSSAIRALIQEGNLAKAQEMLGRPFSLFFSKEDYPTQWEEASLRFPIDQRLCLPPEGTYKAQVIFQEKKKTATIILKNFQIEIQASEPLLNAQNSLLLEFEPNS